jgi:hypothetical protein
VRAAKLYLEHFLGRAKETTIRDDGMADLLALMREAAQRPRLSVLTYETYRVQEISNGEDE